MPTRSCAVCHAPAKIECRRCHNVFYCGKKHMKEDALHRERSCAPYKVEATSKGQRYIIASRDIKEGEVIISEAPLVLSPKSESCPGCFRSLKNRKVPARCPRCKWPICSKKCPGLTDPNLHGVECEVLAAIKPSFVVSTNKALFPLRCLLLQKNDPKKWKLLQKMTRQIIDVEKFNREGRVYVQEAILKPLAAAAPHLLPPDRSPETLHKISGLELFGIRLKTTSGDELSGMFAVSSLMRHSCLPNTHIKFELSKELDEGKTECRVTVRAAHDIFEDDLITSNFLFDLRASTFARQSCLVLFRNEQCFCDRCLDPRELGTDLGTLKCTCSGWIVPVDVFDVELCDWECEGCGKTLNTNEAFGLINSIRQDLNKIMFHKETDDGLNVVSLKALLELKEELETILHPNHHLFLELKWFLINYYIHKTGTLARGTDMRLIEAGEVCRDMIKVSLNPCLIDHSHVHIGRSLLALSQVNLEILKRQIIARIPSPARAEQVKRYCSELKDLGNNFLKGDFTKADVASILTNEDRLAPY